MSSTSIYKLNIRNSEEGYNGQVIRSFYLENVTHFEERRIENPGLLKFYIENRVRGRYIVETIESTHVHSVVLNKLTESLKNELSDGEFIDTEYKIDNEQADLVIRCKDDVVAIYEVKTQETMKMNIRAALGQLTSYSRVIGNSRKKLVVVSNASVDEEGMNFLKYIRGLFKEKSLMFEYVCLK